MVSLLLAGAVFGVLLVGGIRMTREIRKLAKHTYAKILKSYRQASSSVYTAHVNVPLIKLYCRANC
jgi:Ni,Fe-hydrogenase III large subunit